MKAPRPWSKWEVGPVPRKWRGDSTLEAFASRGYLHAVERTWQNGFYAVMAAPMETPWGTVMHVMITNIFDAPCRDWPDLQRIKNELFGEASTAFEIFPPARETIDQVNMTHLWVMPDGWQAPFGLHVYQPELRAVAS